MTLTLRTDDSTGGDSIPSDEILETWTFNVSAVGWDPQLEAMDSKLHPLLRGEVNYWVVAESSAPGGLDGVWNWAAFDTGITSICNGSPCEWSTGSGAVAATIVEGTPAPAADFTSDGVVNTLDLGILLSGWSIPPTAPACGGAADCPQDLNGDGFINSLDLGILLSSWSVK